MTSRRPAQGFRLIRGTCQDGLRSEVRGRIRERWGDAAAQEAWQRVEAGTDQEVEAWLRRSAYFLNLEAMLDLGCPLPVVPLSVHGLLDLLAPGKDLAMSFLLIELAWFPSDWRDAERSVPWLADLPNAERALKHLCSQGWLLVSCPQREQALALWSSVRRGRGIRASRYPPIAGEGGRVMPW